MFITAADLITRFSADELIQLANRSELALAPEMLDTLVAGGDMSDYAQEIQDAVQAVLDVLNAAIEDAESEVMTYLQPRYDLPLSSVPTVLKKFTSDMARYHLHGVEPDEFVAMRYKDALKFLTNVSAGRATLGLDESGEATPQAGGVEVSAPERVFTGDNLTTYLR